MGGIARVAVMFLLTAAWAAFAETPLAVFSINEESIAQIRRQSPLASAEVKDPVYKRTQRYEGIWLRDVLKRLGTAGRAESELYVRFRCKDGYLPMMPLSRALSSQALIAIRDVNAPPGDDWQQIPEVTGSRATPAPSYLVWVAPPGGPEDYPWPYQMVAIELVSSAEALAGVATGSSKPGHELFVKHCLKCHTVNGVGGTFGPELNSPCSVTEYWNPRFLKLFIASPASIRAETKMPDFHSLPDKDIQAIIEYLQHMASRKKPGASCPKPG